MMTKVLQPFKQRLQVGTVLRCVENTYSLSHGIDRSGKLATITKTGVNVFSAEMDGKTYGMSFPVRKSDVIAESEDRVTYKVGRGEHTVTWEIVPPNYCAECAEKRCEGEAMALFTPAPNQLPGQLSF
jgi:hypothetical protein